MKLASKAIENVAIYARVSTKDKGQDTENQLIALREYCKRQGWTSVHEYVDHVSAKRSDNRAQFQALFVAASRREFDVVLVWALDRFSREGVYQTFAHVRNLTSYGVQFESYTEAHFRTTGPAGELMLAVAAWIAEQERNRISERTKAGIERVRREGKHVGRPRKILDRDKVKQLHRQGKSTREIATAVGASHMSVHRIVKVGNGRP
jgi:DNA invertase Pin-like site-specific DNA recombinase